MKERKYLIAEELLETVAKEIEWAGYKVVQTLKGKDLEYVVAKHPLYDRDSLVMCGEHVTLDAGTGVFIQLRDTGKTTSISVKNII